MREITVHSLIFDLMRGIEQWVLTHEKRHLKLFLNQRDKLRLLRLRTLLLRYHVSLPDALDIIVPVLRGTGAGHQKKPGPHSLGLPVAALTGKVAEEVLRDQLLSAGVDWREEERDRQLMVEADEATEGMPVREKAVSFLAADSVADYAAQYTKQILEGRSRLAREEEAGWRKRRRYRNNPWI